jgi:hypothetical protein
MCEAVSPLNATCLTLIWHSQAATLPTFDIRQSPKFLGLRWGEPGRLLGVLDQLQPAIENGGLLNYYIIARRICLQIGM